MFHNGSVQDNINFKQMCPITNRGGFLFHLQTGSMVMEEYWFTLRKALLGSGGTSMIPNYWEIYKLFFIVQNVSPIWNHKWHTNIDSAKTATWAVWRYINEVYHLYIS